MFFDWLTIEQDFGVQLPLLGDVAYQRIHIESGEASGLSSPVFQHQGSFCDSVSISVRGSILEMSGNPSRWGRLDNLFGLSSVDKCVSVYNVILLSLGLPVFTRCTKIYPRQGKQHQSVWRIFGSDKEMTAEKTSFIAEHRHFTHPETGISCDLIIVNQSLSNISRFLKDKIETTYRMRKLKALGLNNHYCVDVYSGHNMYKSNLVTTYRNKYHPEIFDLHQSYEEKNGNEKPTDKRQSIWSSGKVRVFLVLFPFMFLW